MLNREMSDTTLQGFLDGLQERIQDGREWMPGIVIWGDSKDAGMALHDGDRIPEEQFEARLKHHEETHGPVDGVARIELNVCRADKKDFEQEIRRPE